MNDASDPTLSSVSPPIWPQKIAHYEFQFLKASRFRLAPL